MSMKWQNFVYATTYKGCVCVCVCDMIYLFIASINHPKKCYQSEQKTLDPFFFHFKIEIEIVKQKRNRFIDSN